MPQIPTPDTDLSLTERDGKQLAPRDELHQWDDNPRDAEDGDLDRLEHQIQSLGQYKPLIVEPDGTVLGGNMRLEVLDRLGEDHVWVSIVNPDNDEERLEYTLSDNDRAGQYDETELATLLRDNQVNPDNYKVDFYDPQDLVQSIPDAEDVLDSVSNTGSGDGDSDGDGSGDGTADAFDEITDDDLATDHECPNCGYEW